jgi:anti-sigma regulatory factor (Ser/Thr protein kinase)
MGQLRMSLNNRLEELRRVNMAIGEFLAEEGVPPRGINRVKLVVEELVVNIINYAYEDRDTHSIVLGLQADPRSVVLTIEDDGKPFDPRSVPPPALGGPLETRSRSGHGIYIVKHMTKALDYARAEGRNRVSARVEFGPF